MSLLIKITGGVLFFLVLLVVVVLMLLGGLFASSMRFSPFSVGTYTGADGSVVVQHALQMAAHIHPGPPDQLDVVFDAGFPAQALAFWDTVCGSQGCSAALNGNLQCGQFVGMAYGWSGQPLVGVDASIQWWDAYANQRQPGWIEVADGTGVPLPGDILILSSPQFGGVGHSAIVIDVTLPNGAKNGSVTFANANAIAPIVTQPLTPQYHLQTWPGYTVMGYIRHLPPAGDNLPPGLPASPYIAVAVNDAQQSGIPVRTFVAQIQCESGFHPSARSAAGAEGIAQIMPEVAAQWGINPWNPTASLWAAAQHMEQYRSRYGGDMAKALAAYNAGAGAVDAALQRDPVHWLTLLPIETQRYVHTILSS